MYYMPVGNCFNRPALRACACMHSVFCCGGIRKHVIAMVRRRGVFFVLTASETDKEPSLPVPTRDMAKLWGRVRQLRAFLRTQKQEYKVMITSVPNLVRQPTLEGVCREAQHME